MKPEVLEALKQSIKKWKYVKRCPIAYKYKQYKTLRSAYCPLCILFSTDKGMHPDCTQCPVMERTKLHSCVGTPWGVANEDFVFLIKDRSDPEYKIHIDKFRESAQKEIEFLESLFPK